MPKTRFEPAAEILDWTTYKRAIISKGRIVSRLGLVAEIGEVGASLLSLHLPDDEGTTPGGGDALTWSFSHPAHYLLSEGAVGGVIGPVANRIAGAHATLGQRTLKLDANEGENCLHSGARSTLYRFWHLSVHKGGILAELEVPHRADGFPGRRRFTAHYAFNEEGDALELTLGMTSTRDTLVNMTHHPYWNLGGGEPLAGHLLEVPAEHALALDENKIPTGETADWDAVGADFSKPTSLDLARQSYDLHFVLPEARAHNARLSFPRLGRTLTIESDKPGMQVYTRAGGGLDAPAQAPDASAVEGLPEAVCLEPQLHPDAPNHADFPSIELKARTPYEHRITYRLTW
jgi:aldose 1-epimerase